MVNSEWLVYKGVERPTGNGTVFQVSNSNHQPSPKGPKKRSAYWNQQKVAVQGRMDRIFWPWERTQLLYNNLKECHSQKLKHRITQVSNNSLMDQQNVVYTYSGILFSLTKNAILVHACWMVPLLSGWVFYTQFTACQSSLETPSWHAQKCVFPVF